MKFYTEQHQLYCGIDLHARTMFGGVPTDKGGSYKCWVADRSRFRHVRTNEIG
jgi:hypothetical protein